ncbi:hypothetical protein [Streptomyces thermolineatus]|uniref:hypothetical protein n=1 Tax=Streptomyces thermolineatus TaxID=44033 RepID=UPI00384E2DB3
MRTREAARVLGAVREGGREREGGRGRPGPAGFPRGAARRTAAWSLLLAVVCALCQLPTWIGRESPDTRSYLSYSLRVLGDSREEATARTVDYYCHSRAVASTRPRAADPRGLGRSSGYLRERTSCERDLAARVKRRTAEGNTAGMVAPFTGSRFAAIFEARPGYPYVLAPFIACFGVVWGLWAASVVLTVLGGVVVLLVLRAAGAPAPVALVGQGLYYALPSVLETMRPMAEGATLLCTGLVLLGCVRALRGRARSGAALVAAALAAQFWVKYSQGLLLAGCLAAAYAVLVARAALRDRAAVRDRVVRGRAVREREQGRERGPGRRRAPEGAGMLAVLLALAAVTAAGPHLLGWPGSSESMQELLTDHFNKPDVTDPWPLFVELSLHFWADWLRRGLMAPLMLFALGVSAWAVLRYDRRTGAVVIAAALAGVLNQAGHPDIVIGPRLIVLVWFLPLIGLPLLLQLLLDGRVPGFRPAPPPVPPAAPALPDGGDGAEPSAEPAPAGAEGAGSRGRPEGGPGRGAPAPAPALRRPAA